MPQIPALSRERVREIDRRATEEFGVPGIVLMENAGRGVAERIVELGLVATGESASPCLICCGKGNNGGDGFVIARHLDNQRVPVEVLLFADSDELEGDAAANFAIVHKSGVRIDVLGEDFDDDAVRSRSAGAGCLVDALLGTGAKGAPRPPLDRVIEAMNDSARPIIAVDLPSGLDCDSGDAPGAAIRAAHTCTFVAAKPGFFAPRAAAFVGELHVIDIGAPRRLIEESLQDNGG